MLRDIEQLQKKMICWQYASKKKYVFGPSLVSVEPPRTPDRSCFRPQEECSAQPTAAARVFGTANQKKK